MIAIIEKSSEGLFSVREENIPGLIGFGETEQEAINAFEEAVQEQAGYCKERRGVYPEWYNKTMTIDYHYDISGFFLAFPFFNVSKFAEALGINPSLMRKYKEGHATASRKQRDLIQAKYQELVHSLAEVQF